MDGVTHGFVDTKVQFSMKMEPTFGHSSSRAIHYFPMRILQILASWSNIWLSVATSTANARSSSILNRSANRPSLTFLHKVSTMQLCYHILAGSLTIAAAYNIPVRYQQMSEQEFRSNLEAKMGEVTALDFTEQLMIFEGCGMIYDDPSFVQASQVSKGPF